MRNLALLKVWVSGNFDIIEYIVLSIYQETVIFLEPVNVFKLAFLTSWKHKYSVFVLRIKLQEK